VPISDYDRYFGGQPGAAQKAKTAMCKQYGEKRGTQVFYATVNSHKHGGKTVRAKGGQKVRVHYYYDKGKRRGKAKQQGSKDVEGFAG